MLIIVLNWHPKIDKKYNYMKKLLQYNRNNRISYNKFDLYSSDGVGDLQAIFNKFDVQMVDIKKY